MSLYDDLGVTRDATAEEIRKAYRQAAAYWHPDKWPGQDITANFLKITDAYEVLGDPERRAAYDLTGRLRPIAVTPEVVRQRISSLIRIVVETKDKEGLREDPRRVNIQQKIIASLQKVEGDLKQERFEVQRGQEQVARLLECFKPKKDFDPVGESLRAERDRLRDEFWHLEDAIEINKEMIRVMRTYQYKVDAGSEGQSNPTSTNRSSRITAQRYLPGIRWSE